MEFSDSIQISIDKGSVIEKQSVLPEGQKGLLADEKAAISNEQIHLNNVLMGIYRVTSEAREGGMGSVWRVHHEEQDVELAMKRPQLRFFAEAGKEMKEKFIRECESWVGLGLHPNIVACYYVRDISGVPSIFSEWMNGGNLEDAIENETLYDGSEEEKQERLLRIAIQTAQGLHYAHEKGIIHQDVKPDNVLLSEKMDAKVADFGLSGAKEVLAENAGSADANGESDDNTNGMSVIAGSGGYTRAYCSPEQEERRMLGRRTDIYSWAVSVMEMYLGEKRWKKGVEAGQGCRKFLSSAKIEIPEEFKELLIRCMEQKEENRPRDFAEIRETLAGLYRRICGKEYEGDAGTAASDSADSLNNQAVSYLELGMEERAKQCFENAQKVDPSHAEAMYNRGLIGWREGVVTGRAAWLKLLSHPYFYRSEEGRNTITAMAGEAGKKAFDDELFHDEPKHVIDMSETGLKVFGGSLRNHERYFWHEKLYIITHNLTDPETSESKGPRLYIYDVKTGAQIAAEEFPEITATGKELRNASLSTDCRYAFFTTNDHFLLVYDREEKRVIRQIELVSSASSMYDTPFPFRQIGQACRFVWRSVSHGMGHGTPPSVQVYDLKEGKCLEIKNAAHGYDNYSDRQLMQAGEDNDPGKPEGEKYARSLSDGYRIIPVIEEEDILYRCDPDGRPVARINEAMAEGIYGRFGDFRFGVERITPDGKLWVRGREGLMNFDIESGKCLRSFPYDLDRDKFLVDEDGLGIVRVNWDNQKKCLSWQYLKLPELEKEDQAEWLMAKLESFEEYKERTQKLQELQEAFDQADTKEELCHIYEEAEMVRRFFGSPSQKAMVKKLSQTCRQKEGFIYETEDLEFPPEDAAYQELLSSFGLQLEKIPDQLDHCIRNSSWIRGVDVHVTPDAKRVLVTGADNYIRSRQVGSGNPVSKTIPAPQGPGIYLIDAGNAKLYFVRSADVPQRGGKHAVFSKDKQHIIYEHVFSATTPERGKFALCMAGVDTVDAKELLAVEKPGRHSLKVAESEEGGWTILWPEGSFTFTDEESSRQFLEQDGLVFKILDADETYGLIAYTAEIKDAGRHFRVWSTDEGRNIVKLPFEPVLARFRRNNEDGIQLLVSFSDLLNPYLRGKAHIQTYQYNCGYSPLPKRRHDAQIPVQWPEITLPECKWPEGPKAAANTVPGNKSEREMDLEAYALSHKKDAESLSKAHEIYCGLAERFPEKPGHSKNRSITEIHLKKAFQELGAKFDDESLKAYYEKYRELAETHPDKDYYRKIADSAETHYAYALSQSTLLEKKEQAYELFCDLADRHPEQELHAKNREITANQIKMMKLLGGGRQEKKKTDGKSGEPETKKKRFSLFGKKK